MTWSVTAYMHGATVDLTPLVTDLSVRYGGTRKNLAGAMLPPATGTVTLNNQGGEFKAFSPAADIDIAPGPPVAIDFNGEVIFRGWSGGIQQSGLGSTGESTAILILQGALQRAFGYHRRLFLDLSGQLPASTVINKMLDNIQWPQNSGAEFPAVGGRLVHTSRTILHAFGLEQAGITLAGRSRVKLQDALNSIAVLEFGRVYDNNDGDIVFEDRDTVFARRLDQTPVVLNNTAVRVQSTDPLDGVVNVVSTASAAFSEGGNGAIAVRVLDRDVTLPMTISIPAMSSYMIEFDLDTSEWDFVAWDTLVNGTHYTTDIATPPDVESTESAIRISVTNSSPQAMDFTITTFTGSRFLAVGQRVATARNATFDSPLWREGNRG